MTMFLLQIWVQLGKQLVKAFPGHTKTTFSIKFWIFPIAEVFTSCICFTILPFFFYFFLHSMIFDIFSLLKTIYSMFFDINNVPPIYWQYDSIKFKFTTDKAYVFCFSLQYSHYYSIFYFLFSILCSFLLSIFIFPFRTFLIQFLNLLHDSICGTMSYSMVCRTEYTKEDWIKKLDWI